ncbi:MAG: M15 family metallopeptidase [Betaproteobacteria bacterium]|nr:M15 family metallopeptidase [Betaproteobacteria bacterium]
MKNSRSLFDLQPHVEVKARGLIDRCAEAGIDIIVTSTLRDFEAQQALYDQGRSKPGSIVTNAKPGDSAHNYGLAFDVVPMRNGKPVWGTSADPDRQLWQRIGEIGESMGLEWAGRWQRFTEYAHFQMLSGKTIEQLKRERGL